MYFSAVTNFAHGGGYTIYFAKGTDMTCIRYQSRVIRSKSCPAVHLADEEPGGGVYFADYSEPTPPPP